MSLSSATLLLLGVLSLILVDGSLNYSQGQQVTGSNQVEELKAQFKELESDLWGDLKRLDTLYLQQLEKLKQTAQNAGNLDLVLEIDTEIGRLSAAGKTDRTTSKLPDLARLQKIYDVESEKLDGAAKAKIGPLYNGICRETGCARERTYCKRQD